MIIVHHRKNNAAQLEAVPSQAGVEIDIRSQGNELILQHDPFKSGELLSDWLRHYSHQLLILNTKEEGLEQRCLNLMKDFNIENFFFLDQSIPFLIKTALTGEKRCAVRISEYESIQTALSMKTMVDWLWVDCFTRFPLTANECRKLKKVGYKLCIVSPELLGREPDREIKSLKSFFKDESLLIDAVCTKLPGAWE